MSDRYVIQIKDDFSAQVGSHSLKLGANYNDLQNLGIINANEHFATLTFFDDPSVILNNRNGRYPQGFQTPGSCGSGSRPTAGRQRPGISVGHDPRCAAVRHLVPG